MRRLAWWIAPIYAATVSAWLLLVPSYATASSTAQIGPGRPRPNPASMEIWTSLLDVEGWWVLVPLALPVALAVVPVLGRQAASRRRLGLFSAVSLLAFSVVASPSVGYFYLPAVAVLLVAALLPPRPVGTVPSGPAV